MGCCTCAGDLTEEPWRVWKHHPILKQYVVRKDLGDGAFSTVVLASSKSEPVKWAALKVVFMQAPNVATDPELAKLLRKEPQLLQMLDHPNIIACLHTCETDQQLVLVLEHLRGGPLLDRLGKLGDAYTGTQVAAIFRQIASGLAHMHDYGILHRDMKPENCIFVDEPVKCLQHGITPSIKIIDLGMACLYDADHPVKGPLGSPGFVAPEVVEEGVHTPAMDVWSAGVILFVLLVGRKPFNLQECEDLSYAVTPLEDAPGLQDPKWQALPLEAKQLLLGMLEYNPDQRLTIHQVLASPWLSEEAPPEVRDVDLTGVGSKAAMLGTVRRERRAISGAVALLPQGHEGSSREGTGREAYVARFKDQVAREMASLGYRDEMSGRGLSRIEKAALSVSRAAHTRMHDKGQAPSAWESKFDVSRHIRPYRDRSVHGPQRQRHFEPAELQSVHGGVFGPRASQQPSRRANLGPQLRPSQSAQQLARVSASVTLSRGIARSLKSTVSLRSSSSSDHLEDSTRRGNRILGSWFGRNGSAHGGSAHGGLQTAPPSGREASPSGRESSPSRREPESPRSPLDRQNRGIPHVFSLRSLMSNDSAHGSMGGSVHRTIHEGVQLGDGPSENTSSSFYGMRRASSAKLPPLPSLASGSGQGASRDASGSGRAGREWTGPGNATHDAANSSRGGRGPGAEDAGKSVGAGTGSTGAGRLESVATGSVMGVRIRRDSPAVPHVPPVPLVPTLGSPPPDPEQCRHGGSEVAGLINQFQGVPAATRTNSLAS